MRSVFALTMMATVLWAQPVAPVKPKTVAKTKAAGQAAAHKPVASRSAAGLAAAKLRTRRVVTRRKVNGRWVTVTRRIPAGPPKPPLQPHPDPDRYIEIQKSLAERGYFKGEPNGQWNEDSTDALKRFQADQKLPNDGKINALSLIGLGLGPKHDGAPAPPAPQP
jgi:Putative peptidoglycan binding domain